MVLILEEIIPLVVMYAPGLLPSTCILPSQRERIDGKRHDRQRAVYAEQPGPIQSLLQEAAEARESGSYLSPQDLDASAVLSLCSWVPSSLRGIFNLTLLLEYSASLNVAPLSLLVDG